MVSADAMLWARKKTQATTTDTKVRASPVRLAAAANRGAIIRPQWFQA
jgi:hypothetical protein